MDILLQGKENWVYYVPSESIKRVSSFRDPFNDHVNVVLIFEIDFLEYLKIEKNAESYYDMDEQQAICNIHSISRSGEHCIILGKVYDENINE